MNDTMQTWEVVPGAWEGWYEVKRNGVSLGQFPHYSPDGALRAAVERWLNRRPS